MMVTTLNMLIQITTMIMNNVKSILHDVERVRLFFRYVLLCVLCSEKYS